MDLDLKNFKLDIDELLDEFDEGNYTTMADMKRIWMSRKFSYIFEAKPLHHGGLFMQSLYSYAISYMVSEGTLARRLGGLYCLYCLYQAQPYHPTFKIYLNVSELKSLKILVLDAKSKGIGVVPALVKRMIDKGMLLFGSVDVAGGNVNQQLDESMKIQKKRLRLAYEELFGGAPIDYYLGMDLGVELEIDKLKIMSNEYAVAKELATASEEASDSASMEDVKPITDSDKPIVDKVDDIVKGWDEQKERFYRQTGISRGKDLRAVADGFDELLYLLNE